MPIYEYQCEQCKKHTEALQKVDDPPLDTCEDCGGKLQKTIPNSTFHLYGPGFHITDNKRKYLK